MTTTFPEPRAAYIHVPFCAHRCGYCDFTLVAGKDHLIGEYLNALDRELQTLQTPREIDTLFLGGGTPTHLSTSELQRLLVLLSRWFILAPGYEFSVEANPAGFDDDKIKLLTHHGVNRVSLGAQAFDLQTLRLLERDHIAETIVDAATRVRRRIANFSLDLIFGVPHQTLAAWRETLRRSIELQPAHISTYGLTYEKGTAFWSRRHHGVVNPLTDDVERAMYAAAMDELPAAGFDQYELSNFARPGGCCRHNRVYWAGGPYFGFGPGAARYIGGRRETNHRSVTTWLHRVFTGRSPIGEAEQLAPEDRAREALVLGLRRAEGVSRRDFLKLTGYVLDDLATPAIRRHVATGLLEDTETGIRLTHKGKFFADSVIIDFL